MKTLFDATATPCLSQAEDNRSIKGLFIQNLHEHPNAKRECPGHVESCQANGQKCWARTNVWHVCCILKLILEPADGTR